MIKKLFTHTAIYGLAPQVVSLVGIFILPLTTPYLTTTDFGVYGIITAVVAAIAQFQNLGLSVILSNSFYKSPTQYKWLWRQIYGFLILWNLIYTVFLSATIWYFIPSEAEENRIWIIVLNVIPIILFGASSTIGQLFYQLSQKPKQVAIRSVIIGLITVFCNLYTIRYLKMGYMGWFISSAVASTLFHASYFMPLNFKLGLSPIFNFKRKTIIKSLKIALPIIPHNYSGYLMNTFDRVIMDFLGVPLGQIGIYNAAKTPGNIVASGVYAANSAVGPMLLETYKKNDKKTEQSLNFTIIICVLIITSLLALFSKELLPLLIKTPGMKNIYTYAIIIIMAYNYRPVYVAANQRLFYNEKTKALFKVSVAASIISVILNVILIYYFGVMGAVLSMFISFMYMGYSGFYIKEFRESHGTEHYPLFWLILTCLLTLGIFLIKDFTLITKLVFAFFAISIGVIIVHKKFIKNINSMI